MGLEKISKITINTTQNKKYFKVSIPLSIAIDALGLDVEDKNQSLVWKLDKGEVKVCLKTKQRYE